MSKQSGLSLIEMLVGIALMLVVFVGLLGVFKIGIAIVGSSRARVGAVALANEQMEKIRNLPYVEVGTFGGIPSGNVLQTENISLNSVNYIRRTSIQYVDDSADGEGANDENGITTDYKRVRVEVSWSSKTVQQPVVLVSNIVPSGIETNVGGGTLKINVFDAAILPVASANVHIENNLLFPPVSVDVFTNSEGRIVFPGTPSATGYKIVVSKTGYSTARTYDVTPQNPNPQPGHLTIIEEQTTEASFSIDLFSSKTIKTYKPSDVYVWPDSFLNEEKISATSSVAVLGGLAILASTTESGYESEGFLVSSTITPEELLGWQEFSWHDDQSASTTIKYQVLYFDSSSWSLVPNIDLAGNEEGFENSPIGLTGLATSTYPELRLKANFYTVDASTTPSLLDWQIGWQSDRLPLASISFNMRGNKKIGEGDVYKYNQDLNTDSGGLEFLDNLEWDNYFVTVDGAATGYDISESCPFQPVSIAPNTHDNITELVLLPHTNNALLISVQNSSGDFIPGASARLYKIGYDVSKISSASCGLVFFSGLVSSPSYNLEISKAGYESSTLSGVNISGYSVLKTTLFSL